MGNYNKIISACSNLEGTQRMVIFAFLAHTSEVFSLIIFHIRIITLQARLKFPRHLLGSVNNSLPLVSIPRLNCLTT